MKKKLRLFRENYVIGFAVVFNLMGCEPAASQNQISDGTTQGIAGTSLKLSAFGVFNDLYVPPVIKLPFPDDENADCEKTKEHPMHFLVEQIDGKVAVALVDTQSEPILRPDIKLVRVIDSVNSGDKNEFFSVYMLEGPNMEEKKREVTKFFKSYPSLCDVLTQKELRFTASSPAGESIRVYVCGRSTGEGVNLFPDLTYARGNWNDGQADQANQAQPIPTPREIAFQVYNFGRQTIWGRNSDEAALVQKPGLPGGKISKTEIVKQPSGRPDEVDGFYWPFLEEIKYRDASELHRKKSDWLTRFFSEDIAEKYIGEIIAAAHIVALNNQSANNEKVMKVLQVQAADKCKGASFTNLNPALDIIPTEHNSFSICFWKAPGLN